MISVGTNEMCGTAVCAAVKMRESGLAALHVGYTDIRMKLWEKIGHVPNVILSTHIRLWNEESVRRNNKSEILKWQTPGNVTHALCETPSNACNA